MNEKLLPSGPMARRLRVPVRWLETEAAAGRIPSVQCGKVFLFNPKAVEEELVRRASQAAPNRGKTERP